jgi:AraC-like DNA-binding protein
VGPTEWVRAWKPAVAGVREVFHARFVEHAYPSHAHDAWTVFLVDEGAIAYDLDRRHRGVGRARVTLLPPHLVHDGRPASADGYRKRVLYVDAEVLGERLIGAAVDRPDIRDGRMVAAVRALHDALGDPAEAFEAEARFALVADALRAHLGERFRRSEERHDDGLATEFRELLDATAFDPRFTLNDAARTLQASPARLVRSFGDRYGIAPHRYVVTRRIDAARAMLLRGDRPSDVAAAAGFFDQAHLTRHFKRHVGTTPAAYARSARRAP